MADESRERVTRQITFSPRSDADARQPGAPEFRGTSAVAANGSGVNGPAVQTRPRVESLMAAAEKHAADTRGRVLQVR